ncbi:MAG: GNAT family N-acetyltransferase [Pseudomonadales bacterium]|nr:GNAT family N-acetyltransferase [Pseudomonadales bacterium]
MLFKKTFNVWPMTKKHLNQVIALIAQHDEDDAEAARTTYERQGYESQYVLCYGKEVIGVSGSRPAENTDGAYWLSWSYIRPDMQGQGHGVDLVRGVIQKLHQSGARKLFVAMSDYQDDAGNDVYAKARRFYEIMGFKHEATLPDYYNDGEARIVSAIDFEIPPGNGLSWSANTGFKCFNNFELLESDNVYALDWEIIDGGESSSSDEIGQQMMDAKEKGAQRIYTSMPSDAFAAIASLKDAGFEIMGELSDYFQSGVHEINFKREL